MKRIEVNVDSRRELHDLFERELPPPYGRTLDALHDALSTIELALVLNLDRLYEALGERYCENLLRMLENTAAENPKLQIKLL